MYKIPTTICFENRLASNFHYDMGLYQQKYTPAKDNVTVAIQNEESNFASGLSK